MKAGASMADTKPGDAAAEPLKRHWAYGPAAAKWKTSPTPFRTLRELLRKHVPARMLDGLTANIYHMALGRWPGKDRD